MTATVRRLHHRADELAAQGADPLRVELIRRARAFKRSWLDMAEALAELRRTKSYEQWGFADLYGYCAEELLLKRATVDKLTGSYGTLRRHAPQALEDDARLPSIDAVDYFARAMGERGRGPSSKPPEELLGRLRHAVFEETRAPAAIRREFDSELFPVTEADRAERAAGLARKLILALGALSGLDARVAKDAERSLAGLEKELNALAALASKR